MNRTSRLVGVAAAAIAGAAVAAAASAAELPTKKVLSLEVAKRVAAAAEGHARENGWNVCVAIVDDGGNLVYFQRMDGVQTGSVVVSMRKAETAVAFKRPTKAFEEQLAAGRTALVALPGAVPIEGGIPLVVEGEPIGAIGVSGVTAQQDGMIAQAAVDALPGILAEEPAGEREP